MKKFFYVVLFSIGCFMTLAMFWEKEQPSPPLSYNLSQPSHNYQLPEVLKEISGIKFLNSETLACIQDEKGVVYFYNLSSQKITEKQKFEKKGDYEDICVVNDDLYILRSDGDIFRIKNYASNKPKVKKYETRLKTENDTEGLCYDKKNDRLLILCKEKAGDKKHHKNQKAIYAFDLEDKKVNKKPIYTIDVHAVIKLLGLNKKKTDFKPSALAIHPLDQTIYIIDSVEKTLIQLSPTGKLLRAQFLPKHFFPQPEGICFDEKGNLYISSEASTSSNASIYSFNQL